MDHIYLFKKLLFYNEIWHFAILKVIKKRLNALFYEIGKILKEIKLLTYNNIDIAQMIKNSVTEKIKKQNQLGLHTSTTITI